MDEKLNYSDFVNADDRTVETQIAGQFGKNIDNKEIRVITNLVNNIVSFKVRKQNERKQWNVSYHFTLEEAIEEYNK